jgi:hypothetical protein
MENDDELRGTEEDRKQKRSTVSRRPLGFGNEPLISSGLEDQSGGSL